MLWHIIAFSCVFALFIVQQIQIERINKRLADGDDIISKLRSAMLLVLRGCSGPEEFEAQTKREHDKLQ